MTASIGRRGAGAPRGILLLGVLVGALVAVGCGDDDKPANVEDSADSSGGDGAQLDTAAPSDTASPPDSGDTAADGSDSVGPGDTGQPDTVSGDTIEPTDTRPGDSADANPTDTFQGSGASCLEPREVVLPGSWTKPVIVEGDTRGKGDDHAMPAETCGDLAWVEGEGVADEAWSLKAPIDGIYRIELTSLGEDVGLYVLAGCETGLATMPCLGGMDWSDDGPWVDVVTLRLAAGQRIDVIVDGWKEGYEGPYSLAFIPPAEEAPGNRCENARLLQDDGTGAFVGTGDLVSNPGLTDDYSAIGCGAPDPGGRGTGDEVWSFVAPSTGKWKATAIPAAGKDVMIYAFRPGACSQSCAVYADAVTAGSETIALGSIQAGARIELVVDAWWFFDAGPYEIRVEAETP